MGLLQGAAGMLNLLTYRGRPPQAERGAASRDAIAKLRVWGAQLERDAGWLRPNWGRLVPLVHITLSALRLPFLSVSLLVVLSGCWVSAFSFRRRLLCLLTEVYKAQRPNRFGAERAHYRPTVELRAELFCVACLAPLVQGTCGLKHLRLSSPRMRLTIKGRESSRMSQKVLPRNSCATRLREDFGAV